MRTDDVICLADSDDSERSRLIGLLEANRGDLTWQYARELFDLAFPGEAERRVVLNLS